jgi:hypothetical protein
MEKLIISNIKDTFDNVMEDYINSPTYQEERRNVNAMFLKLRGELTPEQASCLNDILNAVDNSNNQLALEALARGVLNGVALYEKYVKSN